MAYAHITEFDSGDDRSTINYDALLDRVNEQGPPEGLIFHCAGFDDHGVFRTFEVWLSSDDMIHECDDADEPRLRIRAPLLEPVGTQSGRPPDRGPGTLHGHARADTGSRRRPCTRSEPASLRGLRSFHEARRYA